MLTDWLLPSWCCICKFHSETMGVMFEGSKATTLTPVGAAKLNCPCPVPRPKLRSFGLGTGQGQFNLAAPTGVRVVALLPSNITPMVSEWNLQIQHQLGNNQSVSIAYVGTHGAHLVRNYDTYQV